MDEPFSSANRVYDTKHDIIQLPWNIWTQSSLNVITMEVHLVDIFSYYMNNIQYSDYDKLIERRNKKIMSLSSLKTS